MHEQVPSRSLRLIPSRACSAFSLPEVAMAIGIIAIAFVALFSLLPAGLNQMRTAMDWNNETRIVQSIASRGLATEYEKLNQLENEIFYFDDEGSPTDTSLHEDSSRKVFRLYAAKVFVEPAEMAQPTEQRLNFSSRLVIAFGNINSQHAPKLAAMETIEQLQAFLTAYGPNAGIMVRTVTIAKTDGKATAAATP
jgi:uncharacterized protein (TIGR02598 family)